MVATLFLGALAVGSLCLSGYLAQRLLKLEQRVAQAPAISLTPSPELPVRPLLGLRVRLEIEQDHPHPLFANLVTELLLAEDVAEVGDVTDPDITISGQIVGNGYAEIYYTAEFTCATRSQPICTVIEKPPHGDRPNNLALELVDKLKRELVKLESREDRRAAIRELSS